MSQTQKTQLEIVCTNCGEPWEPNHAEACDLRDGVWLETAAILREA